MLDSSENIRISIQNDMVNIEIAIKYGKNQTDDEILNENLHNVKNTDLL